MIVKGAVDKLLERTEQIWTKEGIRKITEEDKEKIQRQNQKFSMEGLRVLAFTYREIPKNHTLTIQDEDHLVFLGLIAMMDPPREESKAAVAECIKAGIRPVMITGDHKITAAAIANRVLGSVNAPSLMQKVIQKCVDAEVDVAAYDKNRLALYNGLKECGFECIKPQGAFYLFVKSPVADEKAFCEAGKKYNILMVPGSSFACPGYVRLAYCVSYDTIINSLPEFKKLAEEFGL